jgi:hypothetical protein
MFKPEARAFESLLRTRSFVWKMPTFDARSFLSNHLITFWSLLVFVYGVETRLHQRGCRTGYWAYFHNTVRCKSTSNLTCTGG